MTSDWIDVSMPVFDGMVGWPSDPPVKIEQAKSQESGSASNVSRLDLGSHTGTHVDAPTHFISGGGTVDDLDLSLLVGPASVVEVLGRSSICAGDLEEVLESEVTRVLIKTDNQALAGADYFSESFVYLQTGAVDLLISKGVRLVGVDYLSIEKYGDRAAPVHHRMLGAGGIIVEGLDLSAIGPGSYEMICLPLRLRDLDGSPARVILRSASGDGSGDGSRE